MKSFVQGQRIKDATRTLVTSVFNTFSLFGLLAPLYFGESRGQEGGGGMCSAELVFPDTLLNRTPGRGTFCFRTSVHQ